MLKDVLLSLFLVAICTGVDGLVGEILQTASPTCSRHFGRAESGAVSISTLEKVAFTIISVILPSMALRVSGATVGAITEIRKDEAVVGLDDISWEPVVRRDWSTRAVALVGGVTASWVSVADALAHS
jgi:hypothetical protein